MKRVFEQTIEDRFRLIREPEAEQADTETIEKDGTIYRLDTWRGWYVTNVWPGLDLEARREWMIFNPIHQTFFRVGETVFTRPNGDVQLYFRLAEINEKLMEGTPK